MDDIIDSKGYHFERSVDMELRQIEYFKNALSSSGLDNGKFLHALPYLIKERMKFSIRGLAQELGTTYQSMYKRIKKAEKLMLEDWMFREQVNKIKNG